MTGLNIEDYYLAVIAIPVYREKQSATITVISVHCRDVPSACLFRLRKICLWNNIITIIYLFVCRGTLHVPRIKLAALISIEFKRARATCPYIFFSCNCLQMCHSRETCPHENGERESHGIKYSVAYGLPRRPVPLSGIGTPRNDKLTVIPSGASESTTTKALNP